MKVQYKCRIIEYKWKLLEYIYKIMKHKWKRQYIATFDIPYTAVFLFLNNFHVFFHIPVNMHRNEIAECFTYVHLKQLLADIYSKHCGPRYTLCLLQLDMVFARLTLPQIPDEIDLRDESLLRHLNTKCVRSLNGEWNKTHIIKTFIQLKNTTKLS